MEKWGLNKIRKAYLDFFESKGHLKLDSFPLVPQNDKSILLINAGMTPLKPYFTGAEIPPAKRITTCQKCIRTPDIDSVGKSERHGTFFEMLGNFSFGDYFKKEAIAWAWEFCTKHLGLKEDRLFVSVYHEDDEAYQLWQDVVGLDASKIYKLGKEDNFWEHGTGPCGPCSEIFYDRGKDRGCQKPNCDLTCGCDRFVEIWNLVFTQFDRNEAGEYTPLEQKNIDTGGGLERFATVMQDVDSIFEVDTIKDVLLQVCELCHKKYKEDPKDDIAIRVITDHIRSSIMMISDGVHPENEGRGYVLRRLLRRASRFARLLGQNQAFLYKLVPTVIKQFALIYPQLLAQEELITRSIAQEEESFAATIDQGLVILDELISQAKAEGQGKLAGKDVFRLHDTFGFPLDLSKEIAKEQKLAVDVEGFEAEMAKQRARGRKAALDKQSSAWDQNTLPEELRSQEASQFTGYQGLEAQSKLIALAKIKDSGFELKAELLPGDQAVLVFDQTPFYAEAGGQLGDSGEIYQEGKKIAQIKHTSKTKRSVILHQVEVLEAIKLGDSYHLEVDSLKRKAIARAHTATHLLHKALRSTLGDHVEQAGSFVGVDKLRFDFRHFEAISPKDLEKIKAEINFAIVSALDLDTKVMDLDEAKAAGAMALFSEKYEQKVRVVSIGGDYSVELCGGTHLKNTSEIASFHLVSESGIASGIRRIEALTGIEAQRAKLAEAKVLEEASKALKTSADQLLARIEKLKEDLALAKKEAKNLAKKGQANQFEALKEQSEEIRGLAVIAAKLKGVDAKSLREAGDLLRASSKDAVVILASELADKVLWLIMANSGAVEKKVHAGKLVALAAQITGGRGGGRPDMAQAGGSDTKKIEEALVAIKAELGKE